MRTVLILMIRAYQYVLSPWVGQHCRFYPSCSSYAVTALERFGSWRGLILAIRRLGRCHPWHPGGVDPVPDKQPHCRHHG
ncbi:MAG: membrane protein insertion efficiency factor YidD [Gammaproteobacteria bacterium]|jgi:putative membrane protein insertion efficiency factor|nr:membrane protein insertion efficiency factor YidD [Gammaproteobacteria bacterium]